jgi:hypothetical protein
MAGLDPEPGPEMDSDPDSESSTSSSIGRSKSTMPSGDVAAAVTELVDSDSDGPGLPADPMELPVDDWEGGGGGA